MDEIDRKLEEIKHKLITEFGEFGKGISIDVSLDSLHQSHTCRATFSIGGYASLPCVSDEVQLLEYTVLQLVHNMERALYDMLPVYQVPPQIGNLKIRVDSHLPKGVIWMHPEEYAKLMRKPEFLNLLRHQP